MWKEILENVKINWPIYVPIALVSITFLFVFVCFIVEAIKRDKFNKKLKENSNSVRIYKIDFNRELVTYFNMTAPENVYHTPLGAFYNSFSPSQQNEVRNWIDAIINNTENKVDMLEVDMYDSKNRKQYFSLLQLDAYNPKARTLHLTSHFLKFMEVGKYSSNSIHGLANFKDVVDAINASNKKRGYTIVYRFTYKKAQDEDKEIEQFIFNQLKNALYPFTNQKAYLLELSKNELCLVDLRLLGREKGLGLCRSGLMSVKKYLSINGFLSKIDVCAGIIPNSYNQENGEKLISCAREAAIYGMNTHHSVSWYEQHTEELTMMKETSYKSEAERVINEKKMQYLYRPVFHVDGESVIGYMLRVELIDSIFADIDAFKDSAIRIGEDKDVYSTIIKETIPLFVNSRLDSSQALFLPIRKEERSYMLVKLSHLSYAKEANIIFVYSEKDTLAYINEDNVATFIYDLKSIKSKGYRLALALHEGSRSLPNEVYAEYDFFICSFKKTGGGSSTTAVRSRLHSLVEKLLKFNKPIIANDVEDWGSLELIVRSGIRYFSSEVFAKYSEEIKPVSTKSIRRLKDFSNKY